MDEFARRRVVLDLPGARDVSVNKDLVYKSVAGLELKADVYAPTEAEPKELRPGVILVHGDGPPDLLASAREWGLYESWGRLVAASGLVGIAFNHRSSEGRTRLPEAAGDVEDLLEWVQENHREIGVTPTRLCLWTCSAGPPVAFRKVLGGGLDPVRCLVALYGLMDLEHLRDEIPRDVSDATLREFSPLVLLGRSSKPPPPMLLARAGLDAPRFNASIDAFVAKALAMNAEVDLLTHPRGHHAFDVVDDDDRSRDLRRQDARVHEAESDGRMSLGAVPY